MATLYFYNTVNNNTLDWQTLGNWWTDEECTAQAAVLPTAADDIVVYSTLATNSGAVPTVKNVVVDARRAATNSSYGEVWLSIEINVTVLALFICGIDAAPNCGSYLYTNDVQLSPVAKVNGNCVFRDSSSPFSDVEDGLLAVVNGNAEFYDNAYNYDSLITGNAIVHYPAEKPLGGTVNGTVTYVDFPPPVTREFRALHFPYRRREVVSESDHTPIHVQPGEMLYDEEANKLYAGLEDTNVIEVVGGGGGGGNPFDQDLNTNNSVIFATAQVNDWLYFKSFEDNTDLMGITKENVGENKSVLKICIGNDGGPGGGNHNVNSYYPTNATASNVDYLAIITTNNDVRHLFGSDGKYYNAGGITFVDNTTQTSAGVTSVTTGIAGATRITNMVALSQSDYDALATKDAATLYIING